jgi:hypothetical protein
MRQPINTALEQNGLKLPQGMAGAELEMALYDFAAAAVNNNMYPDEEITQFELGRATEKFRETMVREFPTLPGNLVDELIARGPEAANLGVQEMIINAPANADAKQALIQDLMSSVEASVKDVANQNGQSFPDGITYGGLLYHEEQLSNAVLNTTLRPYDEYAKAELDYAQAQFKRFMAEDLPQWPENAVETFTQAARENAPQAIQKLVQDARENGVEIRDQVKDSYRPEYNGDLPYQRRPSDGDMVRG